MHRVVAAWLITLLALTSISAAIPPSESRQDGKTISAEAYWDLVQITRQAIIQMESQPATEIRQQLDDLASQWEQVTAVALSDGSTLPIDSKYLAAELRETPPNLTYLQKSLDALLRAHQEFPQKVFTLEDVEPLKNILAGPEFQWDQGRAVELPDWLGNLLDTIADIIDRIVFAVTDLVYRGRVLFIIAAAILFVFSLLYISRNLSRSLVQNAHLEGEDAEHDGVITSKSALQRAQALSMQGDYRNAVRYLYLSSLLVLDEQGLLRYDRSRTNREYLRSISSRPELANPLRDVIDVFDRVWYGFESVDEQTYKTYVEHVEELREKKE